MRGRELEARNRVRNALAVSMVRMGRRDKEIICDLGIAAQTLSAVVRAAGYVHRVRVTDAEFKDLLARREADVRAKTKPNSKP